VVELFVPDEDVSSAPKKELLSEVVLRNQFIHVICSQAVFDVVPNMARPVVVEEGR
jgi:hypothetical protein